MTWIKLDDTKGLSAYCIRHHDAFPVASVYVIGIDGHPEIVKIGIAHRPDLRLIDLQGSNPFTLRLLIARELCCKSFAREIESKLHQKYRPFSRGREWFKLEDIELQELIRLMESGEVEAL